MRAALLDLLGPGGRLSQALPGYEHRPEQLAMAGAVLDALDDARPLLVEAGTGTGKTLAYLVPAALSGKKVVISTGTRTLQEQILARDVPLLRERLGLEIEVVALKGISNYLCRRRFAELGDTADPDLVRIAAWSRTTQTGDKSELASVPEDAPAWRVVTTTPDARLGPRCPYWERCFVTQARRAAARAEIIVVNHHLFFADLALRHAFAGAQVLPAYDAVIFDEAHQVEDVATEHFGVAVSTHRLATLSRDALKELSALAAPTDERRAAERLLANLDARADELFAALRRRLGELDGARAASVYEARPGAAAAESRLASPSDLFASPRQESWFRLDAALEELARHAERRAAAAPDGGEEHEAICRRAEAIRADLAQLAEPPGHRHVHWAELRGRQVHLHASPIEVGPLLRERVAEAIGSVVFTSATLTTAGSFEFTRARLGLEPDTSTELLVDSPFDFARQAMLYLPQDLPLPSEPDFADAALARIRELLAITAGRAFVLFTSHRALAHAAAALRGSDAPYRVLVQGERPRGALLDDFRTGGAVLLATGAFWEGVDVPGDSLSLVILEKLPFGVPDEPLTAARSARLLERGEDPFRDYQLPRAALALKQGFGRLIRRRDDRGIVAILDRRILARGYGATFLASLPPATRTSALEQVRRWW